MNDDGVSKEGKSTVDPGAGDNPGQSAPAGKVRIKLFGIGGAGMNAASRLATENLGEVDLIAVNTDTQALTACGLEKRFLVGETVTRGLSAGGDPEMGRRVAETAASGFDNWMRGADVVFLVTGLGGGTGGPVTCAAAEAASRTGALTVTFAVLPFSFEGTRRQKQAEESLAALRKSCDAVIPLPNDILLQQMGENAPVLEVFRESDDWIARGVRSIWSLLTHSGQINLDLGDLRQVFRQKGGKTLYGLGTADEEGGVDAAFKDLLMCPLLHTPEFASRADHLLVHVSAGPGFAMSDFQETVQRIGERFGRDGHLAMGVVLDGQFSGRVEICVLGTTEIDRGRLDSGRRQSRKQASPARESGQALLSGAGAARGDGAESKKEAAAALKARQREFGFDEDERRGFFDRSESNVYEGEDLDVPTYLRRGIRISP